ncbi:hypothetical protein [Dactylosporangium sp. NPDC005555]|uniref:hypothetical protein n=1 Tax=Dactylosporangium sp. NPDC005555 TaxID=3154889 RepID=UPI00339F89CD
MATIRVPALKSDGLALIDLQSHSVRVTPAWALAVSDDVAWRQEQTVAALAEARHDAGSAGGAARRSAADEFVAQGRRGEHRPEDLELVMQELIRPDLLDAVVDLSVAGKLGSMIIHARRRHGLARLDETVRRSDCTVEDLRAVVRDQPWMFGGLYKRTQGKFPDLESMIPVLLTRADGAFHVVEVAAANVLDLIRPVGGGRHEVGTAVLEAVSAAVTQLEWLDALAADLGQHAEFKSAATRRALATVVVGHHDYVPPELPLDLVRRTLRTYSSHLAGIEVITYDELVEAARRVGAFEVPESTLGDDLLELG